MAFTAEEIDIYAQVIHYFNPQSPGSRQPGNFSNHLIHAFATADRSNFLKLTTVYPIHGHAMSMVMHGRDGGIEALEKIVAGD